MGMYDNLLAQERQRVATEAANMQGSGSVYLAAEGAEQMRQGMRGMLGIEESVIAEEQARMAQEQKLKSILQKYSSMNTREDYTNAVNELFANGFTEHAAKVQEMMANLPEDEKEPELSTKEKTMEMAEQFHQCAIDAGGWRKSDEACKAAVKKTFIEMQRGTADEAGMREASILNSKAVQGTQTKIYLDAGNAEESLYSINQSIDLLDDIYAGSAGEGLSNFKKFMVSIGFASKDENMSEEMYRVNSMKAVSQWIQKTKGSISDTEMQAFLDASPSLANTKAGNLLILQTMKNWAEFQRDLAIEWNRWKTDADKVARASGIPVSEVDWQTHLHLWYNTSGKKPKAPTGSEIKAALENDDNKNISDNEGEDIYAYEVGG
jgi:hypothetical protein